MAGTSWRPRRARRGHRAGEAPPPARGDWLGGAGLGWFFFGPRKARTAELAGGVQRATVTVRGGYSPEVIRLRRGVPAELVFDRRSPVTALPGSCSPISR